MVRAVTDQVEWPRSAAACSPVPPPRDLPSHPRVPHCDFPFRPRAHPCPRQPLPRRLPLAVAVAEAPQHALVVGRELRVQRRHLDAAHRPEPARPADHRVRRRHRPVDVRAGRSRALHERAERCRRRPLAAQGDGRRQPGPAGHGRVHHGRAGRARHARHDVPDGAGRRDRHRRHRRRTRLRPAGQRSRACGGRALRDRRGRAGPQRGPASSERRSPVSRWASSAQPPPTRPTDCRSCS